MENILILGVAYNNPHDINSFFNSISFNSNDAIIKVVVLDNTDNDSISNQIKLLVEDFALKSNLNGNIHYDKLDYNLGYFGALNYGINKFNSNQDFVILCNLDIFFGYDFFDNLLTDNSRDDSLAIVPGVTTLDGFNQNPHIIKFTFFRFIQFLVYFSNFHISKILTRVKRKIINRIELSKVDVSKPWSGIGCCYILKKDFFTYFDSLDYDYFLFSEELFFTHQIYSVKKTIDFNSNLKLVHKESSSTNTKSSRVIFNYARVPTIVSYFKMLKLIFNYRKK